MYQYERRRLKCAGREAMPLQTTDDTRGTDRNQTRGSTVDERRMGVVRGLSLDREVERRPQRSTGGGEILADGGQTVTLLRQAGIRRRMQCGGSIAHNVESTFQTVTQLVEACESDGPLTSYNGIGPATAEVIEDWWEHHEERERNMTGASVTERSLNSATIALHSSWADELGIEIEDGDSA